MSATNAARGGKRGNICVGNNVSATMCPRLPGPLNSLLTGSRGELNFIFIRRNHNVGIYSFVCCQIRRMFAFKGSFGFELINPIDRVENSFEFD